MTGTPFCILPTTSLNGLAIGEGKVGEVTSSLLELWSKRVEVDIRKQIEDYGKEMSGLLNKGPNPYQF